MEPMGSIKGNTNAYQQHTFFTCPAALTEVG